MALPAMQSCKQVLPVILAAGATGLNTTARAAFNLMHAVKGDAATHQTRQGDRSALLAKTCVWQLGCLAK